MGVCVCAYSVVYYRVLDYLSAVSTVSLPVFFVMASITEAGRQMWAFFDELRSFLDNSVNGDNQSQLNSSMHHYECVALCKDISLQ